MFSVYVNLIKTNKKNFFYRNIDLFFNISQILIDVIESKIIHYVLLNSINYYVNLFA